MAVFLANVNSSSCSLLCHRPSGCRLSSVCPSSVTLVHPTQTIGISAMFYATWYLLAIHELCIKILPRSSQGNPPSGELNTRGVAEHSDFGPIERYISETMQDKFVLITNRKSHMGFRLVPNSATLDDL